MRLDALHSAAEYDAATAEIRRLLALDLPAGSAAHVRLYSLAALVEAYEAEHEPIEPATLQQIVDVLLEQRGRECAELAGAFGG
jgi:antitoxin component HigA of HigAB toxin-antitoxin module